VARLCGWNGGGPCDGQRALTCCTTYHAHAQGTGHGEEAVDDWGRIEPVILHEDHRGRMCEPLDPERLPTQRTVHIVVTEPGCVRSHHSHPRGTEVLTGQGPALVRLRDEQGVQDTIIPEGAVTRFIMPPGVAPAIQNLGAQPTLLIAFCARADDPAAPDVVGEILIEV
jgi:quercetin dioxygenase-like cupin family protein